MPTLLKPVVFRRRDGTVATYSAGVDPGAADGAYIQNPAAWPDGVIPYTALPAENYTTDGSIVADDMEPTFLGEILGGAASVAELTDVDLAGLANGEILIWDSVTSKWTSNPLPAGASSVAQLTDVDLAGLADLKLLSWSQSQGKWIPRTVTDGINGTNGTNGTNGLTEIVTGFSGPLAAASSGRYYAPKTGTTVTATCSLTTAGTSNTVFTVKKNGVSIGTVTLGSGVNKLGSVIATPFTLDTDYFTVELTTAGAGAAGATIQMRLT